MGFLCEKLLKPIPSGEIDNINVESPIEEYQPEWLKYAIPVKREDTSGRISLFFHGPNKSGKSKLFEKIEKLFEHDVSGVEVGVIYFKTHQLIKGKETYLDFYDIGSFKGNEKDKNWFVERVNLVFIVFDSTSENAVNDIEIYINKIKNRENKDPIKISLWANKMDLINDNNKNILEKVENNINEYKLYKVNYENNEEIKKNVIEFIEDNYDEIKDSLHGIDSLDIIDRDLK